MATGTVEVLIDPFVTIDATAFEDQITSISIPISAGMNDVTSFDSDGWEESRPALLGSTITMDILNSEGASEITTVLWTAMTTRASVSIVARQDDGTIGVANPSYTATAYVESMDPISGAVGDNNATQVSFKVTAAVARATA
jgi:hypothetical protein